MWRKNTKLSSSPPLISTTISKPSSLVLVLFLLVITNAVPGCQAAPFTPAARHQLDTLLAEVMRCGKIPQLTVSAVQDGVVRYERGYESNTARNTFLASLSSRTSKDTVFCLGSSTQAFTSVLLATLLQQNENKTFDTPLHDLTGSYYHLPGRFRSEALNLKDILGMRTGLSNMDIVSNAMGMNRYRLIQSLQFAPEIENFREEGVFSEVLFSLAEDAVIALAGGSSWHQLIRQHIFGPLDMRNTGFIHKDARHKDDVAVPVVSYKGRFRPMDWDAYKGQEIVAPATSVCASATDMSKWMKFILSGGKDMRNQQIVAEEAIQSTLKAVQTRGDGGDPYATGFSQPTMQTSYTRESNALGWIKGEFRGYKFVSQDGSLPGFQSLTTLLPSRSVGVFTAFTGDEGPRAYAAKVLVNVIVLDLMLHGQPRFDRQSICSTMNQMTQHIQDHTNKRRAPSLSIVEEPVRPIEEYEGTYRHYGFGDVFVRSNGTGQLSLSYGTMGNYTLHPTQLNDTFIISAVNGPLWYTTHADEYRKKGPQLAVFGNHYNDPSRRVGTVTIPHFDSAMDPEFSNNPAPPRRRDDHLDHYCMSGTPRLWTSLVFILASVYLAVVSMGR